MTEQLCEGYRLRVHGFGVFGHRCYYDPITLTLVAADYSDDVYRFCGQFYITYGKIPSPGACSAAVEVAEPCPSDAAAD